MKEITIEQPKMSSEELSGLLLELADSKYWPAIQTYYKGLSDIAEQTLRAVDPFKNPTEMARNQGFRLALDYLDLYIGIEKKKKKEVEEKEEKKVDKKQ